MPTLLLLPDEVWKDAVGFEGLYQVSNLGRVKSIARVVPFVSRWGTVTDKRIPEKIMHPSPQDSYGHLLVNLRQGGKTHRKWVHHLVLEAFVGPRPDGMECCHFPDNNPTNNRVENLRWGTSKDNAQDRVKLGTAVGVPRFGADNSFFGKTHTAETSQKISNSLVEAWRDGKFDGRRPKGS